MPLKPLDRKVALVRKRVKQAQIARNLGVSQAYVCDVLYGRRRSEKIETAIADAIGKPVAEVFPPRESAA